eukprot:PRCOL_00003402-RA
MYLRRRFWLVDAQRETEALAAIGVDPKGSKHYVYRSVPGACPLPHLLCSTQRLVEEYLAAVVAGEPRQILQRPSSRRGVDDFVDAAREIGVDLDEYLGEYRAKRTFRTDPTNAADDVDSSPLRSDAPLAVYTLDRRWVGWRLENVRMFFVTDEAGAETLAAVGVDPTGNKHYAYKSTGDVPGAPSLACSSTRLVEEYLAAIVAGRPVEELNAASPRWPEGFVKFERWYEDETRMMADGRYIKPYVLLGWALPRAQGLPEAERAPAPALDVAADATAATDGTTNDPHPSSSPSPPPPPGAIEVRRLVAVAEETVAKDRHYAYAQIDDLGGTLAELPRSGVNNRMVVAWLEHALEWRAGAPHAPFAPEAAAAAASALAARAGSGAVDPDGEPAEGPSAGRSARERKRPQFLAQEPEPEPKRAKAEAGSKGSKGASCGNGGGAAGAGNDGEGSGEPPWAVQRMHKGAKLVLCHEWWDPSRAAAQPSFPATRADSAMEEAPWVARMLPTVHLVTRRKGAPGSLAYDPRHGIASAAPAVATAADAPGATAVKTEDGAPPAPAGGTSGDGGEAGANGAAAGEGGAGAALAAASAAAASGRAQNTQAGARDGQQRGGQPPPRAGGTPGDAGEGAGAGAGAGSGSGIGKDGGGAGPASEDKDSGRARASVVQPPAFSPQDSVIRGRCGFRTSLCTVGASEGDAHFEVVIRRMEAGSARVRVGWATDEVDRSMPVGADSHGYGYRDADGARMHEGEVYGRSQPRADAAGASARARAPSSPAGPAGVGFAEGDVVGCRAKGGGPQTAEILFYRNGVPDGAFGSVAVGGRTLYPAVSLFTRGTRAAAGVAEVEVNFGEGGWLHPPLGEEVGGLLGKVSLPTPLSMMLE